MEESWLRGNWESLYSNQFKREPENGLIPKFLFEKLNGSVAVKVNVKSESLSFQHAKSETPGAIEL